MVLSLLFPPKIVFIATIILALFLLVLYIWQVNVFLQTQAFYESARAKIEKLDAHNRELEGLFSKTEISPSVVEKLKESFEPVAQVVYLRILEGAVARSYGQTSPP